MKTLGEVLIISGERVEPTADRDRLFNYVGLEQIEGHTGKLLQYEPTLGGDIKSTKNVFHLGQILFGKLRPYLNKVHLACTEGICSTDVYVLQCKNAEVAPAFAAYYLRSPLVLNRVSSLMQGANLPRLSPDALLNLPMPVPSIAQQERIVRLLDAAEDLRRLRERADRRTADLVPALFHEMFGDPVSNPKRWPVQLLAVLATNQDGRRKPLKESDRENRHGPYPYYGASGIIDYFDDFIFDGPALLVAEDGANLLARSTPIAFIACGKYWVNNHAHVLSENGNTDLEYLCYSLNLRNISEYVTGSAQPKLNQANLNRIPIPVAPLSMQREFAARVAEVRAMEAKQAESRRRLDDLFQSLLHRAFRGEL